MENSSGTNTYERLIHDVCHIFKDLTGVPQDPRRESAAVMKFARDHGWVNFDFREVIEAELKNPLQREYYSQAGKMNLRSMFNPAREGILLDIRAGLLYADKIREKFKELDQKSSGYSASPDVRTVTMKCKDCDQPVKTQIFIKVPDDKTAKKFKWKAEISDEYERHSCWNPRAELC